MKNQEYQNLPRILGYKSNLNNVVNKLKAIEVEFFTYLLLLYSTLLLKKQSLREDMMELYSFNQYKYVELKNKC